eukprot:TRINITY_DN19985_c0_g2_i1.p1 TRINITY_DN19985_c0_g2~~TRINITY_DN19985_c0_g2_i1.p1  ORF type:complete len:698 (+),score=176.96 TRINITY_DN19985_c0_g2_i1:84-2096(+)
MPPAGAPEDTLSAADVFVAGRFEAFAADDGSSPCPVTVVAVHGETGEVDVRIGRTERVRRGVPVSQLRYRRPEQSDADRPEPSPGSPAEGEQRGASPRAGAGKDKPPAGKRMLTATHKVPAARQPSGSAGAGRRRAKQLQPRAQSAAQAPPEEPAASATMPPPGRPRTQAGACADLVRHWRGLPPATRELAAAQIAAAAAADRRDTIRVDKEPEEKLGVTCQRTTMELLRVKQDSPSACAGVQRFLGRVLTHANDIPCPTLERLIDLSNGESCVYLRFASLTRASESMVQRPAEESAECLPGVRSHILQQYGISPAEVTLSSHLLGSGSFGNVYQGSFQETPVAVKVRKADIPATEDEIIEWKLEVKVMTRLRHPNVLLLIGACFQQSELMIVTELCDRGTLRDVIWSSTPVPPLWREKLDWLLQTAQGMAFLHHRGVRHRDLKPSNVFVAGTQCKVADFGLSKIRAAVMRGGGGKGTQGTPIVGASFMEPLTDSFALAGYELLDRGEPHRDPETGARAGGGAQFADIPGTFAFIAPEVWAEQPYTDGADVYSFGICIIEILTRCTPVGSQATVDFGSNVDWKIMTGRLRPVFPEQLGGDRVPDGLPALVSDCTTFLSEERPVFVTVARRLRQMLSLPVAETRAPWPRADQLVPLAVLGDPHPTRAGNLW